MRKILLKYFKRISTNDNVYNTLAFSNLFDTNWYLNSYDDVKKAGVDPIKHYLRHGAKEGRDPGPHFSTVFYKYTYSDVIKSGVNPLYHYLKIGKKEGRDIKPQVVRKIIEPYFDVDYYLREYPDIKKGNVDPIDHYLLFGWKEGRNPSSDFSTNFYIEKYSDVSKSQLNPFVHFILCGLNEKRIGKGTENKLQKSDYQIIAKHLDVDFYFNEYPDLIKGQIDPIEHYMLYGWLERRDPSPNFSTSFYISNNPDIAKSNVNPFLHYVLFGEKEGRRPKNCSYLIPFKEGSKMVKNFAINSMLYPKKEADGISSPINWHQLDIHWVIPDFNIGSGGHMTILRMVHHLEKFGHHCTIWIIDPVQHDNEEVAFHDIITYFKPVLAQVNFLNERFYSYQGDIIIATGWQTAFVVDRVNGFNAKYYFVQDHEVEFFATGALSLACKETYKLDFGCICASPWLEKLTREKYGRWSTGFHLAYNHDEYFPAKDWESNLGQNPIRIAVYARNTTERRAVTLVLAGLQYLSEFTEDFAVEFFGQDKIMLEKAPFEARDHGVLNANKLRNLYQQCQIGICFSATNYSLVPQEMMACMLPVVELDVESTRAIFPDGVVTFAGPHPIHIAEKIYDLMINSDKRIDQAKTAFQWVSQFDWESSARKVESGIRKFIEERNIQYTNTPPDKIVVDIVIPTYNGGDLLKAVIQKIRTQICNYRTNIICVDSSSSDGTNEWLKDQADIQLHTIRKEEFQHGRTRNYGASKGKGEFIVFITQDAIPSNDYWLHYLVGTLIRYPDGAGAFGRHLPYPEHSIFVHEEINDHFSKFHDGPIRVDKKTDLNFWNIPERHHQNYLHYYSDNNSCMRRSIWKSIPYPEVDYGEDQLWAQEVIDAGYSKIYAHYGSVFHSHNFSVKEMYTRCKIESKFFKNHFGYKLGPETENEIDKLIEHLNNKTLQKSKLLQIHREEIEHQLKLNEMKVKGWFEGHQMEN